MSKSPTRLHWLLRAIEMNPKFGSSVAADGTETSSSPFACVIETPPPVMNGPLQSGSMRFPEKVSTHGAVSVDTSAAPLPSAFAVCSVQLSNVTRAHVVYTIFVPSGDHDPFTTARDALRCVIWR